MNPIISAAIVGSSSAPVSQQHPYNSAWSAYDSNHGSARLAAAALCRQGFNVTPTSRNMAGADLLITDDRCRNTWTIQAKTTDGTLPNRRGWLLGKKAKQTAHKTHAYVFVWLQGENLADFYVVPSTVVARKQDGPETMPEFRKSVALPYKEGWKLLGRPSKLP
jgi:hypothetical protein